MNKKEYKDGLKCARLEGIAQGWQEAKEAQKINLPPVVEQFNILLKSLIHTELIDKTFYLECEHILFEYFTQNRVKAGFTLEEVEYIIKIAFDEGMSSKFGSYSSFGRYQQGKYGSPEEFILAFKKYIEIQYSVMGFKDYIEKLFK